MTKLDFEKVLDDYIKDNQKVWKHDRNKTLGASEVFGCLRKAFFKKTGAPIDKGHEDRWGAAERGNIIEDHYLVPAFLDHLPKSVDLLGAGETQETLIDGRLSATPDGLLINLQRDALSKYGIDDIESDCVVLEFKSVDPRITLLEEKAIHRGQAQTQMGVIRATTDYSPVYAVILYVNASFLDDINVFVVKYNEKIYKRAKRRANKVYRTGVVADDFIKEGKITGACEYCEFTEECWNKVKEGHPKEQKTNFETAIIDRVEEKVYQYTEQRDKGKKAEEKQKEIGEQLRQLLRENETKKIETESWTLGNTLQGGRSTYDFEAMKEDGIDLEKYKKQGQGFEKLTVTLKKVNKDG